MKIRYYDFAPFLNFFKYSRIQKLLKLSGFQNRPTLSYCFGIKKKWASKKPDLFLSPFQGIFIFGAKNSLGPALKLCCQICSTKKATASYTASAWGSQQKYILLIIIL